MNNYLYINQNNLINIFIFLFFILLLILCLLVLYKNKKHKDKNKVIRELIKIEKLTEKENSKIKSTPIDKILKQS